jgi:hypothetical protein
VVDGTSQHTTADLDGNGSEDNLRPTRMGERPELVLTGDMLLQHSGIFVPRHPRIDRRPKGGNFAYVNGHAVWLRLENTSPKYSYLGTLGDFDRDFYW